MKILFDTNVLLDALLNRQPFSDSAGQLIGAVESGRINGFLCATTVTTLHYLAAKALGRNKAIEQVKSFLGLFEIAPVNRIVLESALASKYSDFEDGVLAAAAHHAGVEALVTRSQKDFSGSDVRVYAPEELLKGLDAAL